MVVLEVDHMNKNYGKNHVLKDISFSIKENEVVGLIGHNGAGKTTLIESILGLRKGYSGNIKILGKTMEKSSRELKCHIGVQLQDSAINGMMKVYECIEFQAAAFGVEVDVDELLERFDLQKHKKKYFSKLSGGMQQRLFILLSIVHNPSLLFYDELTTGLDPEARRGIYKYIKGLKKSGKTVFLSTHFMDETQIMCDRVIMLQNGKIIKDDTPQNLVNALDYKYVLSFESHYEPKKMLNYFNNIKNVPEILQENFSDLRYIMKIPTASQQDEIRKIMEANPEVFYSLNIRHATMSDVYDENYSGVEN